MARMFASIFLTATILCALLRPAAAQVNPRTLQIDNPTQWPIWVTVYSAGGVRIEDKTDVGPRRTKHINNDLFMDLTWHVVRFEFVELNWTKRVCDTRTTVYYRYKFVVTTAHYDGTHCSISVSHG